MTPQMLHATLATGQITIWEDRLDVTPKTPQQVLGWLQREEGLRACGFDELDREMQYRLLSHQDRCREMEFPQPDYGAYRFFVLPRGPRTEFLYEEYEWDADYRPVTLYVWQSEDGWLDGNSTFLRVRLELLAGISRERLAFGGQKAMFVSELAAYCRMWQKLRANRVRPPRHADRLRNVADTPIFVPSDKPRLLGPVTVASVSSDRLEKIHLDNIG